MKRCSAKPYEGDQKYIFVSYCHKDKAQVFPIIEQLAHDGYRVWYDEGIDPGSEWPEIIASHLNGCSACIAFISENSLNSHNCRREINFALLKKKAFISVVLEEVHMSLGMEMQLSATQAIFKYTLSTEREFFVKLQEAKALHECHGAPDSSIVVSTPADYTEGGAEGLFGSADLRRGTFSDNWFIKNQNGEIIRPTDVPHVEQNDERSNAQPEENEAPVPNAEEQREEEQPADAVISAESQVPPSDESKVEPLDLSNVAPISAPPVLPSNEPDDKAAAKEDPVEASAVEASVEMPKKEDPVTKEYIIAEENPDIKHFAAWLTRERNGERFEMLQGENKLGRSNTMCRQPIVGNAAIGRFHAVVMNTGSSCTIADNHSLNKTYVNGQVLEPEKPQLLHDGDVIKLANERFVYSEGEL